MVLVASDSNAGPKKAIEELQRRVKDLRSREEKQIQYFDGQRPISAAKLDSRISHRIESFPEVIIVLSNKTRIRSV